MYNWANGYVADTALYPVDYACTPYRRIPIRSTLPYRLLRVDAAAAERVVAPMLMQVPWFSEALSQEAKDTIFSEFNTLSVVFQQVREGSPFRRPRIS